MDDDTLPLFPLADLKKYRIKGRGWGKRSLQKPGPLVTLCPVCNAAYYPYSKSQRGCSLRCSLLLHFWERVEKTETCWIWTGVKLPTGYGHIGTRDGGHVQAHRLSYEIHKGPIPDGLVIDHLCRVRACVNPEHLEPVTHHENIARGISRISENMVKTHCMRGHPFNEKNTYWAKDGTERVCRKCKTLHAGKYYRQNKQQE